VVYEDPPRLLAWAEGINRTEFMSDAHAIGLEDAEGKLLAVAVYQCFTHYECDLHIATVDSGRAMNREFLVHGFSHPFIRLGLVRVTGLIPSNHAKSNRVARHIGFVLEGRKREAFPGCDILVWGMLRRECRFIPERFRT
jgi:hypothetical protein